MSKQQILDALRRHTRETYEMPDLSHLTPITYADPVAEFKQKTTTIAGAKLIEMQEGDDLNAIVRQVYPEARVIAGNLPGVEAQLNPDTVSEAQELACVDVGVIRGDIGVAENACIWVPQTMKERAICFASEQLVIVLYADDIVNNMHEAYARISASSDYFRQYKFGTFISGPSKTADIEGALVYGAQAARAVTVVLVNKE
ncbi:MAG: LUD domain-containing protein [Prevotella sp.]|nr:LUD domain-containing protein [Prevotella sp.]MDE6011883.1 LUD domain-containing protein [Prevotella sp.]